MGEIAGQIYNSLKGFYEFARHGEVSRVRLIIRLIRENDIELVHINSGLWSGKAVILAARLTNTPCVCHMRMFFDLNYFDSIFVRWVDHFVYISTAIAGYFTAQGISPTKGTVIHNAVDLIAFSRPCEVSVVRKEFGWTESELVVGNIGRLDWWKGHEYFLEAVADLSQKFPHIRALIVGPPESSPKNQAYFQKLRELTLTLGLENKVVFTGFRSDVPCLMSAVDIIVLSSSEPEPFGRVVIEGMAAGKPVVATAAGGVLDIIEDGVTGLLVPPRNAGAMAEAIEWLVVNQDKAHHIGRAARQHVVQTFALHRHITAVQNVYDAVLNLTSEFSKQPSVTKRMI
jgi:glycosyltransferase involved in cell wall biosynthesis